MGSGAVSANVGAAPDHSSGYRTRRFLNWFPLGLTYAFLYMGRYNLNVAKNALGPLMTEEDFGIIFAAGTLVYGFAFVLNGPLTDKIGGKLAMLIAAVGSAAANLAMGSYLWEPGTRSGEELRFWFSVLYAVNMYFQSFGAVAIVKVNSAWFHVRERGGFSGIFGTMISSGIFMAFTVNAWLLAVSAQLAETSELRQARVVFIGPALLLLLMFVVELFLLKDRPGQAGHQDFDTGDASSGEGEVTLLSVMKRIVSNPVILTVAAIEFCTGIVRQAVMQSYPFFAKSVLSLPSSHAMRNGSWGTWWLVGLVFVVAAGLFIAARFSVGRRKGWLYASGGLVFLAPFLQGGWGGLLFVAGVVGGNLAGYVSDLFFQSRRAPAAGGLYGVLFVGTIVMALVMGRTAPEIAELNQVVTGRVDPGSKVEVAGVRARVDAEGKYRADVPLHPGVDTLELVVTTETGGRTVSSVPVDGLRPGDRILAVAGQTGLADWVAVTRAVASVPPSECLGGARWDPHKAVCSTNPSTGEVGAVTRFLDGYFGSAPQARDLAASAGLIVFEVERAGQRQSIEVRDWAQRQRAGEPRVLKATPTASLSPFWLGAVVIIMSLCVIGTHGLLSGTATMDFGGRKGAATAVGMIDGAVYLGTAVQSISLGYLTTRSWSYWPYFMMPFALAGFLLCLRIWNAKPTAKKAAAAPSSPSSSSQPAAPAPTGT